MFILVEYSSRFCILPAFNYILIYLFLGHKVTTEWSDFCLSSAMFQLIQKTGNYNVCKLIILVEG